MSDELQHLEEDLLGQLRKMQDYLASLEARHSELMIQNDVLKARNQDLHGQLSAAKEYQTGLTQLITESDQRMTELHGQLTSAKTYQSSLETQNRLLQTQNQTLNGQLNDVKSYQRGLMDQTEEAKKQINGLITTQKELQTANQSLRASIKALQSEQDQPPAPLMMTTNEPFMSEKDELIEKLQTQLALETKRNSEMRATIMLLERR